MWSKVNHGGEPTKNPDKKYAIFVGRYQPYHYGHIELIQQKLDQGIPALIMVEISNLMKRIHLQQNKQ